MDSIDPAAAYSPAGHCAVTSVSDENKKIKDRRLCRESMVADLGGSGQ